MMLSDETFKAYLDQQLSPEQRAEVEQVLQASPQARQTLAQLQSQSEAVSQALNKLTPSQTPNAHLALHQFKQANTLSNKPASSAKRINLMLQNRRIKQYQPALISLALVMVIAIAFSFAPVRALAGNFLQIFRVQKVEVVPITQQQLNNLENNAELETFFTQLSNDVEVLVDGGEGADYDSLEQAQAAVDFTPRQISSMESATAFRVEPMSSVQMMVNRPLAQAIFDAAQIDINLPNSLDDTPVLVTKPDILLQGWGGGKNPRGLQVDLMFAQMLAPQIEYPDDLNLAELGTAALQLTGMSELEAKAVAATIDWENTIVLPVPASADMRVEAVTVQGNNGQFFTSTDQWHTEAAIIWQADGMSFLLAGRDYNKASLLALAETVQ